MNFLGICKRVRQEVGVSGDGPVSVSGQTGMYKKIGDWVLAAHEEIQLRHNNWRFDWATVSTTLTGGTEFYQPTDVWSLPVRNWDWDSMYCYPTADGVQNRTWQTRLDYNAYRQVRIPSVQGRPIYVTWKPNKELGFYPIPLAGLTFVGDYYMVPEVMANNTDIPRMPDEYHMAIVWRAVMFFCSSEENPALYQVASLNYNNLIMKMESTEIDGPMDVEPLA